jgi:antitoxin VapB
MTKQARLFTNGGSQAVRLPAEFRFADVDTVYVRHNAAGEVILSRQAPRSYATFLATRDALGDLPDDFLSTSERDQRHQSRDPFDGSNPDGDGDSREG